MTLKCGVNHEIKYSELVQCTCTFRMSNVTLNPLHTANSKTMSHLNIINLLTVSQLCSLSIYIMLLLIHYTCESAG